MKAKSMTPKARVWWAFVQGILLPIQHKTSITKKRLWCLYTLMEQEYIDVGRTIANEIHALHSENKGSLSYARIITQLCIEAGVTSEGLIPMQPSTPIKLASILGPNKVKKSSKASSSKASSSKQSSKAKVASDSSSSQEKILRHLKVVQENIQRVHEHTKVVVMLEPLMRVVVAQMNFSVENLIPVEAKFDEAFIADLMRFEEFSDDEEVMDTSEDESDD